MENLESVSWPIVEIFFYIFFTVLYNFICGIFKVNATIVSTRETKVFFNAAAIVWD